MQLTKNRRSREASLSRGYFNHPDENKWYSYYLNRITYLWQCQSDIVGVLLVMAKTIIGTFHKGEIGTIVPITS